MMCCQGANFPRELSRASRPSSQNDGVDDQSPVPPPKRGILARLSLRGKKDKVINNKWFDSNFISTAKHWRRNAACCFFTSEPFIEPRCWEKDGKASKERKESQEKEVF